jgi:hypothetical protein
MEYARIDIIADGDIRREGYSNRFTTALSGSISTTPRARAHERPYLGARIAGPIRRLQPISKRLALGGSPQRSSEGADGLRYAAPHAGQRRRDLAGRAQ